MKTGAWTNERRIAAHIGRHDRRLRSGHGSTSDITDTATRRDNKEFLLGRNKTNSVIIGLSYGATFLSASAVIGFGVRPRRTASP
jgi:hypothetical protein